MANCWPSDDESAQWKWAVTFPHQWWVHWERQWDRRQSISLVRCAVQFFHSEWPIMVRKDSDGEAAIESWIEWTHNHRVTQQARSHRQHLCARLFASSCQSRCCLIYGHSWEDTKTAICIEEQRVSETVDSRQLTVDSVHVRVVESLLWALFFLVIFSCCSLRCLLSLLVIVVYAGQVVPLLPRPYTVAPKSKAETNGAIALLSTLQIDTDQLGTTLHGPSVYTSHNTNSGQESLSEWIN